MKLTREEALKLHRQMWSDMQEELGDTPDLSSRILYKEHWCETHGFEDMICYSFLCEYADSFAPDRFCKHCPIEWPGGHCGRGDTTYDRSPISKILALPERKE